MTRPRDSFGRNAEMPAETAAAMERRLLEAFAAHHGIASASGREPRVAATGPSWRRSLAAAAAVILIAGTVAAWRALHSVEPEARGAGAPASVITRLGQPARPVASRASDPVPVALGSASRVAGRMRPAARLPVSRTRPAPRVESSGFIALPGADNMPQFESGTIVRMDVPVASLPSYGVDISRAGGDGAVEADFLVAQDGRARAIRLVTNQQAFSRSR